MSPVDVDRQEAALVVVGVEQRQLLVAVDHVAGVPRVSPRTGSDIQRHGLRRPGVGVDPGIDERVGQADHVAQARRVLQPRHGRLRAEIAAAVGQPPAGELEGRIATQVVEIVGVLVAHRDGEDPGADHVGQCVRDPRRIAAVGHQAGQARGDAEPPLGHGQQHHAAVRGQPTAVEIGCDLPPLDGWKRERRDRIVGHGGRGRCDDARMLGLDTQAYAKSET